MQLARVFGIRIGVSMSWLLILFILIWWLGDEFFPSVVAASRTTAFLLAVAAALGYFGSLILHELGHALAARRLGIPVVGIDLWFFGGMSRMTREPGTPGEEFKIAAAGPLVTLALFGLCLVAAELVPSGGRAADVTFAQGGVTTTPALALIGWLGFVNAVLFLFNIVPAFPLDGGRIARAAIWKRSGDRNRATLATGRMGQAFAIALGIYGLWSLGSGTSSLGLLTVVLALILYQAAGAAVLQGTIGRRVQSMTVADVMDRRPVTIPAQETLLEAREQYFQRLHRPWFAVVDSARHFLGVVRQQRVEEEISAGRPALAVGEVLETDLLMKIGGEAPLEVLLGSEGLGRLGAMVAVDSDGVLQGVVTLAELRQALNPAA
jgi:Zn-dependent protease